MGSNDDPTAGAQSSFWLTNGGVPECESLLNKLLLALEVASPKADGSIAQRVHNVGVPSPLDSPRQAITNKTETNQGIHVAEKFDPDKLKSNALTSIRLGVEDYNNTIDLADIKKRFDSFGISTDWTVVKALQNERNNVEHLQPSRSRMAVATFESLATPQSAITGFRRSSIKRR